MEMNAIVCLFLKFIFKFTDNILKTVVTLCRSECDVCVVSCVCDYPYETQLTDTLSDCLMFQQSNKLLRK